MQLSGLHLLLTQRCTRECDHCFVWGSPSQSGTMTLEAIHDILRQGRDLGGVEWIYFEGGEPFLYYPVLCAGVREAAGLGFQVGIVTNAYWATHEGDALEWLRPLAGAVQDLTISSDLYHGGESAQRARLASLAAGALGISASVVGIRPVETACPAQGSGRGDALEFPVMFRGRAAEKLAPSAPQLEWESFTECPHEDLREPERVHVGPDGEVHLCQGISLGNLFRTPLGDLCGAYVPETHPIAGPLLQGGPAELARRYGVQIAVSHADACQLCDETRRALRPRFPAILRPDAMYGVVAEDSSC